jgi:hypothetical protein
MRDPGEHLRVDLDSAARSEPRAGRSSECAGGSYSGDNQDQVHGPVEPVVAADTQVRVAGIDAVHRRSGEDRHTSGGESVADQSAQRRFDRRQHHRHPGLDGWFGRAGTFAGHTDGWSFA